MARIKTTPSEGRTPATWQQNGVERIRNGRLVPVLGHSATKKLAYVMLRSAEASRFLYRSQWRWRRGRTQDDLALGGHLAPRRLPLVAISFAVALTLFALLAAITRASSFDRTSARPSTPAALQPLTATVIQPLTATVTQAISAPFVSPIERWMPLLALAAPPMDRSIVEKPGALGKMDIDLAPDASSATTDLNLLLSWFSTDVEATTAVAWGDVDNDGDLDLAVGNRNAPARVVLNVNGVLTNDPNEVWSSQEVGNTTDSAWGDIDNDGDLDLVTAGERICSLAGKASICTGGNEYLYINHKGQLIGRAAWSSREDDDSTALALGDVDGDGYLDLAVSNRRPDSCRGGQPCPQAATRLYLNKGGVFSVRPAWTSKDQTGAADLAWADVDGDGDLDLISAAKAVLWYKNVDTVLTPRAASLVDTGPSLSEVVWTDVDQDGFDDLLTLETSTLSVFEGGPQGLSAQPVSQALPEAFAAINLGAGDYDADGYPDLAVVGSCSETPEPCTLLVYHNVEGRFEDAPVWQSSDQFNGFGVAWGDVDRDGDLDLAVGVGGLVSQPNRLYRNLSTPLSLESILAVTSPAATGAISQPHAWGDVDGDGDLDLAVGRSVTCKPAGDTPQCSGGGVELRRNDNGSFAEKPAWISPTPDDTSVLAWGDVDNDGDPDLVVGNMAQPNRLYRNLGGVLSSQPAWQSRQSAWTQSLAWGDVDGDGDLDLAVGNRDEAPHLYRNDDGQLTSSFVWTGLEAAPEPGLAWGDADGDGDLDLAVGSKAASWLYLNQGGTLAGNAVWTSEESGQGPTAWRDADNDGDLDLLAGDRLFRNVRNENLAKQGAPGIAIVSADRNGVSEYGTRPPILDTPKISVTYRISQPQNGDLVDVRGFYSLNGGGAWLPASVFTGTHVLSLVQGTHVYVWDVARDGLMGRSDNVVVRLDARPAQVNQRNSKPAVSVIGPATATTEPFRVRGTQVRVYHESKDKPAAGAVVFRLKKGDTSGAEPLGDAIAAYRTDVNGYLQGRGEIKAGDTLFALLPVTASLTTPADKVTVYHTSYTPIITGLVGTKISGPGLQELVVSEKHPLLLFDLELSLEWDARNDGTFLADLEQAIKRSSEVLFDVTNGQMALGKVTVFQGRGNWLNSDIVMYGNNSIRPRASMGGVVQQSVNDAITRTEVIAGVSPPTGTLTVTTRVFTDAFLPGQIRMGPLWDPFGESRAELQQDWWRAFAHEFGHYLLYLPDNYLGYNASGVVPVDCKNSFMTTTYGDDYSEFLTATQWKDRKESCDQTIAARTTGRSDWETIKRFYPMVDALTTNPGPAVLPLNLTEVRFVRPSVPAETLPARNFDLRAYGTEERLVVDQGRAFLFQTQGTKKPEDDTLIDLGSTGRSDSIKVRGAQTGDRVCVFDTASDPPRVGCNSEITAANPVISLDTAKEWGPNIAVQPLSLPRWVMTVTQPISGVAPEVQAIAISGPQPVISVTHAMSGFKPVTLLRQDDGPMFAIAVTGTMTGSQPRLVIKQVSGPAAAISVTQAFADGQPAVVEVLQPAMAITVTQPGVGDALHVQVFPAYRIPHRPYSVLSPCILGASHAGETPCMSSGSSWTRIDSMAGAGSSATYRVVMPLDYPLFGGFVRVWSKKKEAISQFSISRDRSPDGGVRWGGTDGFTMGVDDRLGLGPNDRYDGAGGAFGLGADDRFASADDRFASADDRFASADDRFASADDRFASADDRFASADDRFASADDRFASADDRFASADYRGYGANRRSLDAPIASEDAQVIIFNREDVLGDPGALSLQALASVPNLDPWLTSVGRGFRFQVSAPISRTIAFNYLRREVPEGYEQNLQIYYSPDEGGTWKRLPTYLDMKENLATAPADASGLYVLAAAVDIPLYTPGWNLFAYPVPKTRSVDETLLSVTTAVTTVFGYDSGDVDDPWKVYDRLTPPWVNDLENFEFGHAYWISVTRPITLQLAVAEAEPLPGGQARVTTFANLVARRTPPGVFYGEIDLETPAGIAQGDSIVAKIDGVKCGEGKVKHSKDGAVLGYVIKVDAADVGGKPECGAPGRKVSIEVGGRPVAIAIDEEPAQELVPWNNTRPQAIKLRLPG